MNIQNKNEEKNLISELTKPIINEIKSAVDELNNTNSVVEFDVTKAEKTRDLLLNNSNSINNNNKKIENKNNKEGKKNKSKNKKNIQLKKVKEIVPEEKKEISNKKKQEVNNNEYKLIEPSEIDE